jgi:hypothetical protein
MNFDEMYEKLEPKIEEIKSRYPKECNIEGLEPALSTDITEIVLWAVKEATRKARGEEHQKCTVDCPYHSSHHSINADGSCNCCH